MINPLEILNKNKKPASIKNPFILRFDGKYYLYTSALEGKNEILCYVSEDLINYQSPKAVLKDELALNGYGPSVMYFDGVFYMLLSSNKEGHYLFTAKSPLGPFKIASVKIDDSYDGIITLNRMFEFKLFRGSDSGFVVNNIDINGNISNRRNILKASNMAMENPSIIYRDNRYYLTYTTQDNTTNHRRICYLVSKEIDNHYEIPDYNPLLLVDKDIDDGLLGNHCSVLSPDLDGYYLAYEKRLPSYDKKGKLTGYDAKLCLDRLHINGYMVSAGMTSSMQDDPKMPNLYNDFAVSSTNFRKYKDKYLSNDPTGELFTAEFNTKGHMKAIVSYENDDNYILLKGQKNVFSIINYYQGRANIVVKRELPLDFKNHHTVTVINEEFRTEYLLDGVQVAVTSRLAPGKIGYITENKKGIGFTAFSNHSLGNSDLSHAIHLPGRVDCLHDVKRKETVLDNYDDTYFSSVYEKEVISFKTSINKKEGYYHLAVLINPKYTTSLRITSLLEEKVVEIDAIDIEYPYYYKDLGLIKLARNDEIKIRVNKGVLVYKCFDFTESEYVAVTARDISLFNNTTGTEKLDFIVKENNKDATFGICLNVTNFENADDFAYTGYFVGVINNKLRVLQVNYGTIILSSMDINLEVETKHQLKTVLHDSKLLVYLDDKEVMSLYLPNNYTSGLSGIYKNEHSKIEIK